jgi:hypothetical protein
MGDNRLHDSKAVASIIWTKRVIVIGRNDER